VQVLHHLGQVADGVEQVVGHVLGEVRDELDALEAPACRASARAGRRGAVRPSPWRGLVAVDRLAESVTSLQPWSASWRTSARCAPAGGSAPGRGRSARCSRCRTCRSRSDADVRLERRRPHRRVARAGRSSRSSRRPRAARPRRAQADGQCGLPVLRTFGDQFGHRPSWPGPTTMSTYGARLRISSWSFCAMQPSTPMTFSGCGA
jgi:hypothetical protein